MADFFEFREKITRPAARVSAAGGGPLDAADADAPGESAGTLSVSELAGKIEGVIRKGFPGLVSVKGEVSNARVHGASGHLYFSLKDESATIAGVMWAAQVRKLGFEVTDGMMVIATGNIKTYPKGSSYQLSATAIAPAGQGALELAKRQLLEKLKNLGLLDAKRKRPVPAYPRHLVLVTSRQTAAFQDMLKVFSAFRHLKISIYHVPVQGDGAGEKMAAALEHLSDCVRRGLLATKVDAVILGRGGGSHEDLWCFNDEHLAHAIANCAVPVVTGIGHEIDTSVADLVADHHAHTPTAAAEFVTRYWRVTPDKLTSLASQLGRQISSGLQAHAKHLDAIERHEFFRKPTEQVNRLRQNLDEDQRRLSQLIAHRLTTLRKKLEGPGGFSSRLQQASPAMQLRKRWDVSESHRRRLDAALHKTLTLAHQKLEWSARKLAAGSPQSRIRQSQERLEARQHRLQKAVSDQHKRLAEKLLALTGQLRVLGPESVLSRGFSLTFLPDGSLLRQASQVFAGDKIITQTAKGNVESVVHPSASAGQNAGEMPPPTQATQPKQKPMDPQNAKPTQPRKNNPNPQNDEIQGSLF